MTKIHQRIFATVAAFVFLLSVVGFTVLVIADASKKKNAPSAADLQALQKQVEEQGQQEQPKEETGANKLQGTTLANFTAIEKVDELKIVDLVPGTGDEVKAGATVSAHYTGAVAKTGKIFESSKDRGQPATFPLANVIQGWQEGVPGMKVGGTRRLIIPAAKAYGEQSPSEDIPANSDLVFDIELTAVK